MNPSNMSGLGVWRAASSATSPLLSQNWIRPTPRRPHSDLISLGNGLSSSTGHSITSVAVCARRWCADDSKTPIRFLPCGVVGCRSSYSIQCEEGSRAGPAVLHECAVSGPDGLLARTSNWQWLAARSLVMLKAGADPLAIPGMSMPILARPLVSLDLSS